MPTTLVANWFQERDTGEGRRNVYVPQPGEGPSCCWHSRQRILEGSVRHSSAESRSFQRVPVCRIDDMTYELSTHVVGLLSAIRSLTPRSTSCNRLGQVLMTPTSRRTT